MPEASEERFGLVSGFADVMAAIGLLLVALAFVGMTARLPLVGLLVVPCCWWAANLFTKKRRLLTTSFVIFGAYALSIAMLVLGASALVLGRSPLLLRPNELPAIATVVIASATCLGCALYWRQFRLPVAYAAAAVAFVNVVVNLLRAIFPELSAGAVHAITGLTGPALFALAMAWDVTDIRRETVRSDVAFWLHIAAGFLIVKSGMGLLLGAPTGSAGWVPCSAPRTRSRAGGSPWPCSCSLRCSPSSRWSSIAGRCFRPGCSMSCPRSRRCLVAEPAKASCRPS